MLSFCKIALLGIWLVLANTVLGSIMSYDLSTHILDLSTQKLTNSQKNKNFVVLDDVRLVASDPSGREPDDLITSSPNEGDTLSILYLDKAAGRIFYKVIWG